MKGNNRLFIIFTATLLMIWSSCFGAEPLTVTASVSHNVIAVNQQLTLTVEYSGEGAWEVENPELPDMGGYLAFLGSGGTSQNMQFINGKMSRSKSISFLYMATKEGKFTIPVISVTYKNKKATTQPIEITITKAAAVPPQSSSSGSQAGANVDLGDDLFIRAIPNKRTVYPNEPVIITYRIYLQVNVASYNLTKLSETDGFWVEEFEMPAQPQIREEIYNGKKYTVADLKKIAVFPTSAGEKTIGAMGISCDVRVQQQRRQRSIMDSFFDDPFFGRTVRKTIYSQPVKINVIPLPAENKPHDFSGAVGQFNLQASVDKNQVKTNEAITFNVRLSGTGNINTLPMPEVFIPNDFERYDPKATEKINRENNTISGFKAWEYVLVPRFAGQQRIRPVRFSYFDPHDKKYKVLTSPEILIDVAKGETQFAATGSGFSKEEVRLIGQEIRFIKLNAGMFSRLGYKNYTSGLFFVFLFLPMLTLGGAVGFRIRSDKLAKNVAYARRSRANKIAMRRLSKAKNLLHESTQKEFYAEISRSLLGYAADKLNISQAGIISSELYRMLIERGVDSDLLDRYRSLIEECDFQRFAPANITEHEMTTFYEDGKKVIIKLEKAL
ncbi:protein BatD [candidate division KSB1 bacterium]|nr:protein BatD [candidate division KSB1 bacterium]